MMYSASLRLYFAKAPLGALLVQNEQLPPGVVAIAVAWRWRMTFATIIAGLVALHFFAWLM
jgi:branched-subunit amino acid transport protein